MISDICRNCGKKVYLAKWGRTFRWMDNPKIDRGSWRCPDSHGFLTHAPQELIDAQDRDRKIPKNDSVKQSIPTGSPEDD